MTTNEQLALLECSPIEDCFSTARNKKMCVKRCVVYVRMPHSKFTMLPKEIFHFARSTLLPVHPCRREHNYGNEQVIHYTLLLFQKLSLFWEGEDKKSLMTPPLSSKVNLTWTTLLPSLQNPEICGCHQDLWGMLSVLGGRWWEAKMMSCLWDHHIVLWACCFVIGENMDRWWNYYSCHCLCAFSTVCLVLSTAVKWWHFKFWTRSKEKTPSCMHYKYMLKIQNIACALNFRIPGSRTLRVKFSYSRWPLRILWLALYLSHAVYFRTKAAAYEIYENNMPTKYSGFTVILLKSQLAAPVLAYLRKISLSSREVTRPLQFRASNPRTEGESRLDRERD